MCQPFWRQIGNYRLLWSSKKVLYFGLLCVALCLTQCTKKETPTNQPPAFGKETYTFKIPENSAAGTAVGSVTATDPEEATLSYSLVQQNGVASTEFQINALGGISVKAGASLDYETKTSYTLKVEATDQSNPPQSQAANVTINVTDVDEAPSFGEIPTLSVDENSAAGTAVGSVTATDPEEATLSYSLVQQNGTASTEFQKMP